MAGAFASDLADTMGPTRMALSIYGHTHSAADIEVRGTRVLSNPRGNPHEPVAALDHGCVVELGADH